MYNYFSSLFNMSKRRRNSSSNAPGGKEPINLDIPLPEGEAPTPSKQHKVISSPASPPSADYSPSKSVKTVPSEPVTIIPVVNVDLDASDTDDALPPNAPPRTVLPEALTTTVEYPQPAESIESVRRKVTRYLTDMTEELRRRGAIPPGAMADTLHKMNGSPVTMETSREEYLLEVWEEAIETIGIFDSRLISIANHQNRLARRMSEMIVDGGLLIHSMGPEEHSEEGCHSCGNCRSTLLSTHALMKRMALDMRRLANSRQRPPTTQYFQQEAPTWQGGPAFPTTVRGRASYQQSVNPQRGTSSGQFTESYNTQTQVGSGWQQGGDYQVLPPNLMEWHPRGYF